LEPFQRWSTPLKIIPLLRQRIKRPLFLPAHTRGATLPAPLQQLLRGRPGSWDLPELPELGGPLLDSGAVADSQRTAATAMGAQHCWFGVHGATGLLQAALLAITSPGQAVLLPRNVHRSVIQACLLGHLTPVLFDLPWLADRGQPAPADEAWLNRVLAALPTNGPAIAAALLVHPTYQGYATDPTPLIRLFHERNWPVLVDEAHGSHFAIEVDPALPHSALHCGADLVVHSLHKSASGLAQTAVLWLQGDRIDPHAIHRSLSWLQTTSPSALLLASCEAALAEWQQPSGRKALRRSLDSARNLADRLREQGVPLLVNQDPLRLVLHTGVAGISGLEADHWFLPRGLAAELPEPATLTFCLGFKAHRGLERHLCRAWSDLVAAHPNREAQSRFIPAPLPLVSQPVMELAKAWRARSIDVDLDQAVGGIAAELVCPYPPGIPIVIPGERIDQVRLNWLINQRNMWGEQIPKTVRLVVLE
tara:strand:- start:11385 stop:12818 length:1434 start_codon:yes stop_codon:yes gene_type:complete